MYVKPFEDFVVEHFLAQANESINAGFKYQFKSPNIENSLKLFRALSRVNPQTFTVKTKTISFIDVGNVKLIPVIHKEGKNPGYTENFISYLRDEVSSQAGEFAGTALLIIHNSMLDTLINSSEDITKDGSIFDPIKIKQSLADYIDSKDSFEGQEVSKILLDYQYDIIVEDQSSMFGFEPLHSAIADGDIRFHEIGLIEDPAILNMADQPDQMKKRLDDNKKLYDQIQTTLEHYPDQLVDQLPDMSESFVKKNFLDEDDDAWKLVTYDDFVTEQTKNRQQNLTLVEETSAIGKLIVRTKSDKKTAQKERHILLVVDDDRNDFDINIEFTGDKISKSELKLIDKSKFLPSNYYNLQGGARETNLTLLGAITDKPVFFMVSLNRSKSSEKFKFKCLVVKSSWFNTKGIENSFLIDAQKQRITLQTQDTELEVGTPEANELGQISALTSVGDSIDITETQLLKFDEIANEVDQISFNLVNQDKSLTIDIEGAAATEDLSLPIILDTKRGKKLFSPEFNGVFNVSKERIYVENKELKASTDAKEFLKQENTWVDNFIVGKDHDYDITTQVIRDISPAIADAYDALFSHYIDYNTLPSLAGWNDDYCQLVTNVCSAYTAYLESLELNSYLDDDQKKIIELGMSNYDGEQWITPFSPLVLNYYLQLVSAAKADDSHSFLALPNVTLKRLNPQGLLPYIYDLHHDFSYVQASEQNCFWLQCVPQQQSDYSYIAKLVREKVREFSESFDVLFQNSAGEARPTLTINSINNYDNHGVFNGIVDHLIRVKNKSFNIHVNIYDDEFSETEFDRFTEMASYETIKQTYGLNKGKAKDSADTIVDLMRSRISYSKFCHDKVESHAYAHLSFFRNNEKVEVIDVNPDEKLSGISANGLISGEASSSEKGNYITGFGLQGIEQQDNPLLKFIALYSRLIKPARKSAFEYRENSAIALAVNERFKEKLELSYDSSVWTSIIDPKVTLDFFETNTDAMLIHYSDQYTSSAGYDAITVTKQTELYDKVLEKDDGGLVSEFNAFNGEWLLKLITDTPQNRKGNRGIIAAYKLVSILLSKSDITWVPMSAAELVRVAGNIGLKIDESEFSRKGTGPISDDVLFVGFKEQSLYLLPLEVKTGVKYSASKAVKQSVELGRYLTDILTGEDLASQLYRSLFIRQALMQVDKYQLYNVFPDEYFNPLLESKEFWLQGDYQLSQLANYPKGFVVANLEEKFCFRTSTAEVDSILKIEVPASFIANTISSPLQSLWKDYSATGIANVSEDYFLKPQQVKIQEVVPDNSEVTEPEKKETEDTSELPDETDNSSLEDCRVLIGQSVSNSEGIYWEYGNKNLANRHLIVFGKSGQGKTYCIQALLMELAKSQLNSMVIDYTDGFLPDKLEKEFIEKVQPKTDLVVHKPLDLNPFNIQKQKIAGIEISDKTYDVASRVASVFNAVYSDIGSQQLPTLIRIIEDGLELFGVDYTFDKMLKDLQDSGKHGEVLANKLSPMVRANLFSCEQSTKGWEGIYKAKQVTTRVIQLARLSRDTWRLATEFILWDLFSYVCANGDKNIPIPVVLDEVQNLDQTLDSPLGKMLTEGRKYGLSLILATQTLSNLKKEEQDRLFQAAHKLFFKPAETEAESYAKLLEQAIPGSNRKRWGEELANLQKGECISVGLHVNSHGQTEQGAKVVKVSSLGSRL